MATKAGDFIDQFDFMVKEQVTSDILPLDIALNRGLELGGCYAIASKPGGGKSTMLLQLCKSYCDAGRYVVYLDIEQGLKPVHIKCAGLEKYLKPIEGETYPRLKIINTLYRYTDCQKALRDIVALKNDPESGRPYSLVVSDSLSQLVSKAIEEGDAEAATIAADARPLAKVLKSIKAPLGIAGITFFNVVQAASNIGGGQWESDWIAKITKQLEHAVDALLILEHSPAKSYIIWGNKKTPAGEVPVEIGYWGKLYTTKARLGLNRIKIEIPMIAGVGCDSIMYLKKVLLNTGVFVKGTKYYRYKDANGVEQALAGEEEYSKFVAENYHMLVDMMYDLGFFDLTNNATVTQIGLVEPPEIADGVVTEEELRNETSGTVEPANSDDQFI